MFDPRVYIARLRRRWWAWVDPIRFVASLGVPFGRDCRFIKPTTTTFGSEPYLVKLGDHVTVGEDVRFITHDGGVWVLRSKYPQIDVIAPIVVGDNVFIGSRAIILPGVVVGSNVVIAAGSIVTSDAPSNCVVAGAPGRVVSEIDDYERRSVARSMDTKGMSNSEKRRYLIEAFDLKAG